MNKKRIYLILIGLLVLTALIAIFFAPLFKTPASSDSVFINQWGFLPHQNKLAVLSSDTVRSFTVTDLKTNQAVMKSKTELNGTWQEAGKAVALADISGITSPGEYRLSVEGASPQIFAVRPDNYATIHDAAIKAFYYARAGVALDPAFAGKWHRPAGHPDTAVGVLDSPDLPASPRQKGWYDAGDYNKYVVNSGISTYTLLRAYLDHPAFYRERYWNIPESVNERADILDEILWNLDWLVTMQADDGGVYHKLTTLNFAGPVMPHKATKTRYATAKSTAATLNFAAVMSMAARVFEDKREVYLDAARQALEWARQHPQRYYRNEQNVHTGEYGDKHLEDEFRWARIEYAISTSNSEALRAQVQTLPAVTTPSWASVDSLGYVSALNDAQTLLSSSDYQKVKTALLDYADHQVNIMQAHALRVPTVVSDFVWGSNAVMMNKAMLLEVAFALEKRSRYRDASLALVDYISGRNLTGFSFVTGFGNRSPRFIHHRPSQADNIADPVPGWLVGGPQNGHQDECKYPSDMPAMSYLDAWCSYSTNEVAINWNAPLVYVLASISAMPDTPSQ